MTDSAPIDDVEAGWFANPDGIIQTLVIGDNIAVKLEVVTVLDLKEAVAEDEEYQFEDLDWDHITLTLPPLAAKTLIEALVERFYILARESEDH